MLATNLQCVVFAYFRYPQSLSYPLQEINMRLKINFTEQTHVSQNETWSLFNLSATTQASSANKTALPQYQLLLITLPNLRADAAEKKPPHGGQTVDCAVVPARFGFQRGWFWHRQIQNAHVPINPIPNLG